MAALMGQCIGGAGRRWPGQQRAEHGSILQGGVGAFGTSASWGLTNVLAGNIGSTFGGAMSMLGPARSDRAWRTGGRCCPVLLPLALFASGAFGRKHEQHNLQGHLRRASNF